MLSASGRLVGEAHAGEQHSLIGPERTPGMKSFWNFLEKDGAGERVAYAVVLGLQGSGVVRGLLGNWLNSSSNVALRL